jgi:hypothetical protein
MMIYYKNPLDPTEQKDYFSDRYEIPCGTVRKMRTLGQDAPARTAPFHPNDQDDPVRSAPLMASGGTPLFSGDRP